MFTTIMSAIGSSAIASIAVLGLAVYGGYVLVKLIVDKVKR